MVTKTRKAKPAKKTGSKIQEPVTSESVLKDVPKEKTLFFVLVKPDGMYYRKEIQKIFLEVFANKRLQAEVIFSKVIKKGRAAESQPYGLASFYDKPDEWLIKYGKKIIAENINHSIMLKSEGEVFTPILTDYIPDWLALKVGQDIPEALVKYMSSGDMYAIIFSINSSEKSTFEIAREALGHVDPSEADFNSVRGRYSNDSFHVAWTEEGGPRAIHNICHCSESSDEVHREISVFLGRKIADKFFPEKQDSLKRLMKEMSKTK